MSAPGAPSFNGFIEFIRNTMGIDSTVLPDNSVYIPWAYQVSLRWVNTNLQAVIACGPIGVGRGGPDGIDPTYPSLYTLAVYNLAGDNLVNYAQDIVPNVPVAGGDLPYFANLRAGLKIDSFTAGAVSGTSDEGTSVSIAVPKEIAEGLTFANLQQMKTPWGRAYLGIAQSFGPSIWGVS